MSAPVRLLFVCTANRVRSPMAAAVARGLVAETGVEVEVRSAGFMSAGRSAVDDMREVAAKLGYDLSTHVSSTVDAELLASSDLVVGMTGEHVVDLVGLAPSARGRIVTLREWARASESGMPLTVWTREGVADWASRVADRPLNDLLSGALDIRDPIGGPRRGYRRAANEIAELLGTAFGR